MQNKLIKLRRLLHSKPELAGEEQNTAELLRNYLDETKPNEIISGLGGHGLAAVYAGRSDGPRVMIRCELDALPIQENILLDYASEVNGQSHKCGHDGHMAIVAGLATKLHNELPTKGSVVLLFQPAEETGEGANQVITDPKFKQIKPDYVFALHNLPGFPLGEVIVSDKTFASASTGFIVKLHGKTSHAAEPEAGNSPALAVSQLINSLSSLAQFHTPLHQSAQVTVIHAKLGEEAFGTSPGEGVVMATIRSHSQEVMNLLVTKATALAHNIANVYNLDVQTLLTQPFPATVNHPEATKIIVKAGSGIGMNINEITTPFAWSEDFGHFTACCKGALFGLGAGTDCPVLHHPEYDFPEALIESGIILFMRIIKEILG